jgi:type IV conjugative transfer system coupling protein TraD
MAFFKTLTQGGQTNLHQLRMLNQILYAGLIVAFISGVGYFAWRSYEIPRYLWTAAYEVYWARFMLISTPDTKHKTLTQLYTPSFGKPYTRKCISITGDKNLKRRADAFEKTIMETGYKSLKVGGISYLIIMVLWFFYGLSQKKSHLRRGNLLVSWKELRSILIGSRHASDLRIGKLPLVKGEETSHILVTGTTGSGKTNTFHILSPQIRKRKNKAIVVDLTGTYVQKYYNEETDIILNPLDIRSQNWHPWADCLLDSHYDILAKFLIQPDEKSNDSFWIDAARKVFKTGLRKYEFYEDFDIEKFYKFLTSSTDREFEDFFRNTEAAVETAKHNMKMTYSIRAVLNNKIGVLRELDTASNPFSIRKWVMDDAHYSCQYQNRGSWLFITARADQTETLIPLISFWIDVAVNAIRILPESFERRLWFIIDELAELNKLPSLGKGLTQVRKCGGCFLTGFQSKPQLEDIYGDKAAAAMLDQFNTQLFFRSKEPSTQAWISKVLGDKEEDEPTENISFGANSLRDGVSLGHHTHVRPLVMPSELGILNNLECYIKLPGNYPIAKLKTKLQRSLLDKNEPFELKEPKKRDYTERSFEVINEVFEEDRS